jgi:hypothetical protein
LRKNIIINCLNIKIIILKLFFSFIHAPGGLL